MRTSKVLTFNVRLFRSDWCAFHILRTTEQILTAWGSPPSDSSSVMHFMTRTNGSDLLKVLRWKIKWVGLGHPAFANSSAISSSQGTSHIILQGFVSILSAAGHFACRKNKYKMISFKHKKKNEACRTKSPALFDAHFLGLFCIFFLKIYYAYH